MVTGLKKIHMIWHFFILKLNNAISLTIITLL